MLEMQRLESAIEVKRAEMRDMQVDATTVTAWIGGIPLALARNEDDLRALLSSFGELQKISVRVKPGVNKSWCLATFHNVDALERLTRAPIPVEAATESEGSGSGAKAMDGPAVHLVVKEADVQAHLEKGGDEGTLRQFAAEHESKIMQPRRMKKPKKKVQADANPEAGAVVELPPADDITDDSQLYDSV